MFEPIDGWTLLRQKQTGTFRIAPLFKFSNEIFAQHGNGYIRIKDHGTTSNPGVFWERIEAGHPFQFLQGKMVLKDTEAA